MTASLHATLLEGAPLPGVRWRGAWDRTGPVYAPRRAGAIPVRFEPGPLALACAHAHEGLHEPWKREVMGFLLGRVGEGRIDVRRAIPYRTPLRSRTVCDPHPGALRARARALSRSLRERILGTYHSHPEEAGSRSHALSPEDVIAFFDDRPALLEVVISVARTSRAPAPPLTNRDGSLSLRAAGCAFRLSGAVKAR